MSHVEQLFGHLGSITRLPGRDISAADIADADLLLVRSVTPVNQSLLEHSPVQFVGSATIGTDHIDQDYLLQCGIGFAHAPGCNADAVVQYDLSVLSRLQPDWLQRTVGIIGCGNVGRRLYNSLTRLGVTCRVYDPFLSAETGINLVDFDTVLTADIICVHTPLTDSGPFPTRHLFNAERLAQLGDSALLINAGRGAVIDNAALLDCLNKKPGLQVALDVWEGEPHINLALLDRIALATPHIAGYSIEGKVRGTAMLADAYGRWCQENQIEIDTAQVVTADNALQEGVEPLAADNLNELILASYDVADDDRRMRAAIMEAAAAITSGASSDEVAKQFDLLRKQYPERHEFGYYRLADKMANGDERSSQMISTEPLSIRLRSQANTLGFS